MARRTRAIICFFACIAVNHIFPSLATDAPDAVTEFLFETTTENISCAFQGDEFVCDGVICSFPDIHYCGGLSRCDVVCRNCSLPDFDENTFPSTGQRIVSFNVSFSEIEVLWPNAFRTMSSTLEKLDLSHNSIYNISGVAFSGLTNLEELYLQYNNITGLPSIFSGLSHLKTLDLSNNHIKGLDLGIFEGLTMLEELDLSNNSLTNLRTGTFSMLPGLKTLNLSSNSLTKFGGNDVVPLRYLNYIDIANNQLNNVNISNIYSASSSLKKIRLEGNIFDCSYLTEVVEFLRRALVEIDILNKQYFIANIIGIPCIE